MPLGPATTRKFGGEIYHLRVQPSHQMHRAHLDPFTIRYKYDADLIAKNQRTMGHKVRVVKVEPSGWRIYWRK
jgi:hypothetical protein